MLALLLLPWLVGQWLFGEDLIGIAVIRARVAGIALVALAVACWPGTPLLAMVGYGAGSALYLAYLGFTAGYAPGSGPDVVRAELAGEAIRLTRLLRQLLQGYAVQPPSAATQSAPLLDALLALMLLQHSRREARVDDAGRLVLLPDQDRGRWKRGEIADALDDSEPQLSVSLINEAKSLVASRIVAHEQEDEAHVYPAMAKYLRDGHGLAAMSRAHREILHLSRLLVRLSDGLTAEDANRYLVRDAQRIIESIEALVRIHNAQEEDIYEHAASA